MCPSVCMTSAHPCTTVWLSLSTLFSHPCTTLWLSLSMVFSIYKYSLTKFIFGDVVGDLFWRNIPCFEILFLLYKEIRFFTLFLHPIKYHIRCLGYFLSDSSGNNTFRSVVICFYWGWWLGKSEFVEINAEGYSCLPNMENSPDLWFDRGSHHVSQYSAFYVDRSILWGWEVFVEFTFCVCRNSYRLIKTKICINTLLSSLLDR